MKKIILLAAIAMAACMGGAAKIYAAEGNASVTALSDESFRSTVYDYVNSPSKWNYKGGKVAVIDFYADWCGPCRMVSPLLDALAGEYGGRVAFYKVNVDDNRQTAAFFRINAIPLVMVVPVGGEPVKILGARGKDDYRAAIEKALKK